LRMPPPFAAEEPLVMVMPEIETAAVPVTVKTPRALSPLTERRLAPGPMMDMPRRMPMALPVRVIVPLTAVASMISPGAETAMARRRVPAKVLLSTVLVTVMTSPRAEPMSAAVAIRSGARRLRREGDIWEWENSKFGNRSGFAKLRRDKNSKDLWEEKERLRWARGLRAGAAA